jgi:hypothetical protein
MIFRRGKKKLDDPEDQAPAELGAESELADVDEESGDGASAADSSPEGDTGADAEELDVAGLDARDWRGEGPYDIKEVDHDDREDEDDDEAALRIDLGSLILTPFPDAELRLQVTEDTSQIVSAMLISGNSALELGAYAAPRSGGLWAELREDMMASSTEAGGSAALVEGPFGVELRRLLPVTTPEGEEGYQPSRMWVAEGPRWLLRGIVYGQAALEEGVEPPTEELLNAFRQVIVRRGDEAMAPGDLLPLTMPANLVAPESDEPA